MCLKEDVLCLLPFFERKSGNDVLIEVMKSSRFSVSAPLVIDALEAWTESGHARIYTQDGRRDGLFAQERIKCTMPLYRQYQLTRIGNDMRRHLMSRKRSEELRKQRRASM